MPPETLSRSGRTGVSWRSSPRMIGRISRDGRGLSRIERRCAAIRQRSRLRSEALCATSVSSSCVETTMRRFEGVDGSRPTPQPKRC